MKKLLKDMRVCDSLIKEGELVAIVLSESAAKKLIKQQGYRPIIGGWLNCGSDIQVRFRVVEG